MALNACNMSAKKEIISNNLMGSPGSTQNSLDQLKAAAGATPGTSALVSALEQQANYEMYKEDRDWQKQESELAFQRSTASSQVERLMAAGMSRAGALAALSGSGEYSAAGSSPAQFSGSAEAAASGQQLALSGASAAMSYIGSAFNMFLGAKQAKNLEAISTGIGIANQNELDARSAAQMYSRFDCWLQDYNRAHPEQPLGGDISSIVSQLEDFSRDGVEIKDDSLRGLVGYYKDTVRDSLLNNPYSRLTFRNMYDDDYRSSWYNEQAKLIALREYDLSGVSLQSEVADLQSKYINLAFLPQEKQIAYNEAIEQVNLLKQEQMTEQSKRGLMAKEGRQIEENINLNRERFNLEKALSADSVEYARIKTLALKQAYYSHDGEGLKRLAHELYNDQVYQDVIAAIQVEKAQGDADFQTKHPTLAGIDNFGHLLNAYCPWVDRLVGWRKDYMVGTAANMHAVNDAVSTVGKVATAGAGVP